MSYGASVAKGAKSVSSWDRPSFSFLSKEEDRKRLHKAYIGEVNIPGSPYSIQTSFEMEGVFSIKVTPLVALLCLLEEIEEGFIKDLLEEGNT